MIDPFHGIERDHFGVIYADPPWHWKPWKEYASGGGNAVVAGARATERHYKTMKIEELGALPVGDLAAKNCVMLLWATPPLLLKALWLMERWGFAYKTIGFSWLKADGASRDLFPAMPRQADMKLGFWTRSNGEVCLLGTRGKPKRLHADVRMGIIEPAREHSRKPDCVPARIERLVAGPYMELFARTERPGWTSWGDQVGKFRPPITSPIGQQE